MGTVVGDRRPGPGRPLEPSASSFAVGSGRPWQEEPQEDRPVIRAKVLTDIVAYIETKKPEWSKGRVLHLATQLEESLYQSEESQTSYMDASSLNDRVDKHCLLLGTRKRQCQHQQPYSTPSSQPGPDAQAQGTTAGHPKPPSVGAPGLEGGGSVSAAAGHPPPGAAFPAPPGKRGFPQTPTPGGGAAAKGQTAPPRPGGGPAGAVGRPPGHCSMPPPPPPATSAAATAAAAAEAVTAVAAAVAMVPPAPQLPQMSDLKLEPVPLPRECQGLLPTNRMQRDYASACGDYGLAGLDPIPLVEEPMVPRLLNSLEGVLPGSGQAPGAPLHAAAAATAAASAPPAPGEGWGPGEVLRLDGVASDCTYGSGGGPGRALLGRARGGRKARGDSLGSSEEMGGGGSGGGQVEDDTRGHALRMLQSRLLLLMHSSRCEAQGEEGCVVFPRCQAVRRLLRHLQGCQRKWECDFPHCISSRCVLSHYHFCEEPSCQLCRKVRDMMQNSAWMQLQLAHKRRLQESKSIRRKRREELGLTVPPPKKRPPARPKFAGARGGVLESMDASGKSLGGITPGFFLRQAMAAEEEARKASAAAGLTGVGACSVGEPAATSAASAAVAAAAAVTTTTAMAPAPAVAMAEAPLRGEVGGGGQQCQGQEHGTGPSHGLDRGDSRVQKQPNDMAEAVRRSCGYSYSCEPGGCGGGGEGGDDDGGMEGLGQRPTGAQAQAQDPPGVGPAQAFGPGGARTPSGACDEAAAADGSGRVVPPAAMAGAGGECRGPATSRDGPVADSPGAGTPEAERQCSSLASEAAAPDPGSGLGQGLGGLGQSSDQGGADAGGGLGPGVEGRRGAAAAWGVLSPTVKTPSLLQLEELTAVLKDTSRQPSYADIQSIQSFLNDHDELRNSPSFGNISALLSTWGVAPDDADEDAAADHEAFSF